MSFRACTEKPSNGHQTPRLKRVVVPVNEKHGCTWSKLRVSDVQNLQAQTIFEGNSRGTALPSVHHIRLGLFTCKETRAARFFTSRPLPSSSGRSPRGLPGPRPKSPPVIISRIMCVIKSIGLISFKHFYLLTLRSEPTVDPEFRLVSKICFRTISSNSILITQSCSAGFEICDFLWK